MKSHEGRRERWGQEEREQRHGGSYSRSEGNRERVKGQESGTGPVRKTGRQNTGTR